MGLAIDTSALVLRERAGSDWEGLLADLDEPVVLPAIVYAELLVGAELARGATALHLGFAVLVGGRDEKHFRRVPRFQAQALSA